MIIPRSIYCDGGLIGHNPSRKGGTWAWVSVGENGVIVSKDSGVLSPDDIGLPVVTNNVTELYAAARALGSVPQGWNGAIHTDSQITMYRLEGSMKFKGVPPWLVKRVKELRKGKKWKTVLVAGHPTPMELHNGIRLRNKLPTSKYNVMCDQECCRLADLYRDSVVS